MKTILSTLSMALLLACLSCNANTKNQTEQYALKQAPQQTRKQFIQVALLLDTSNSMDGLIDQAKAQLWDIVNELSYAKCNNDKPQLQIAIYEYGNDNLNAETGHIRQVLAFSNDLDEISKQLFSLTTRGGEEYCGQVVSSALEQLSWNDNPDDLKLIFIAGNEPYTQGQVSYKDAAKKARTKNVTVNTIFCGEYDNGISGFWKDGSDLALGNYMAINQNKATTYVATPFDKKILENNEKLNKTYVAYNAKGSAKIELQSKQDKNARAYSSSNAVSRTVSKSSHLYQNDSWDLVDASEKKDFKYEDLKESELPKELQEKSTVEIKTFIASKKTERKKIQDEIQTLNAKRKQYLLEQQKGTENALENAMIKAIKTQAKLKNYIWE